MEDDIQQGPPQGQRMLGSRSKSPSEPLKLDTNGKIRIGPDSPSPKCQMRKYLLETCQWYCGRVGYPPT